MGLKPMKTPVAKPSAMLCGLAPMRRSRCQMYRNARLNPERGQIIQNSCLTRPGLCLGLNMNCFTSPLPEIIAGMAAKFRPSPVRWRENLSISASAVSDTPILASTRDPGNGADQGFAAQRIHNRRQMLQIVDLEHDVKVVEIFCMGMHLQLIDVSVEFPDGLRHLRQRPDFVVDGDREPGWIAQSVVAHVPGQIHPSFRLIVEGLEGAGENRIDRYSFPLRQDADDAVARDRAGLRSDANWQIIVTPLTAIAGLAVPPFLVRLRPAAAFGAFDFLSSTSMPM